MKSAVPEKYHCLVRQWASEGKSAREISAQLGTIGVKASHTAVLRLLRESKAERAEVAKAVVREELSTTLTADIRRLERLVKKTIARIRKNPDNDAYCKLAEQTRKLIETKLKYSGADEADPFVDLDVTVMTDEQLDRLIRGDTVEVAGKGRGRKAR